jgi:hypothetical protein
MSTTWRDTGAVSADRFSQGVIAGHSGLEGASFQEENPRCPKLPKSPPPPSKWLLLTTSPMKRVLKPRVPEEQITPLTGEEVARLLEQPDRTTFTGVRDASLIAFLAGTGIRVSEAPIVDGRGNRPTPTIRVVCREGGESADRFLQRHRRPPTARLLAAASRRECE